MHAVVGTSLLLRVKFVDKKEYLLYTLEKNTKCKLSLDVSETSVPGESWETGEHLHCTAEK